METIVTYYGLLEDIENVDDNDVDDILRRLNGKEIDE